MLSEALHQPHFSIEKLGYLSPLQHFFPPLHSSQTSPTFLVFILFYCAGCCISHSVSCLSNQSSSWVSRSQMMLVSFSNKIACSPDHCLQQTLSPILRILSSTSVVLYCENVNCSVSDTLGFSRIYCMWTSQIAWPSSRNLNLPYKHWPFLWEF